jgi:hypothetical protein
MIWPGLILMVCGFGLRVWGNTGVEHTTGVVSMVVGAVAVAVGVLRMALRARRAVRRRLGVEGLRYTDPQDFTEGVPPDYRTSRAKIVAMVLVLVYLFSPVDLAVLELLLPVGVIGDTGAMAWLVMATGQELTRYHRARTTRRALRRSLPKAP